jgi:hypothetical protein
MNGDTDSGVREARVLDVLRDRPEWPAAMRRLRQLYARGGAAAQEAAARYGQKYAGQRGAMVVDVVASRQRNYLSKVHGIVRGWREEAKEPTLAWLAANPPDRTRLGLMASEPETMRQVAENLAAFARSRGLDEEKGCHLWAKEVDGLILQPEIVIFMVVGRLAVGSGRHARGLAAGVATRTSATGGRC